MPKDLEHLLQAETRGEGEERMREKVIPRTDDNRKAMSTKISVSYASPIWD